MNNVSSAHEFIPVYLECHILISVNINLRYQYFSLKLQKDFKKTLTLEQKNICKRIRWKKATNLWNTEEQET